MMKTCLSMWSHEVFEGPQFDLASPCGRPPAGQWVAAAQNLMEPVPSCPHMSLDYSEKQKQLLKLAVY